MSKKPTCEIRRTIALVDETDKSAVLFGEISWNGREPRGYDIRHYNRDDGMCYKGITVSYEGFKDLIRAAIAHGCITKDELLEIETQTSETQPKQIFTMDDFDSMFNRVSESTKYWRDPLGLLRDKTGRVVILPRKRR